MCRIPDLKYASKMREKTKSFVLSVDLDDPSTSNGITDVCKKILPYIPVISSDGHVRKKTCLMGESRTCVRQPAKYCLISGDQGLSETSYHSIYARSSEEKPEQRLSPFVPQPQEWHAMKAAYHPEHSSTMCSPYS